MTRVMRLARDRANVIVVLLMLGGIFLLPKRPPLEILLFGVVAGSALALQSMGLIMVFKSNRIINFAQFSLGGTGAVLMNELVHTHMFAYPVFLACQKCVVTPYPGVKLNAAGLLDAASTTGATAGAGSLSADAARHLVNLGGLFTVGTISPVWLWINFFLSLVAGLVFAGIMSMVFYHVLVRRFQQAPRLVLTAVTLAVTGPLALLSKYLPILIGGGDLSTVAASSTLELPFEDRGWQVGFSFFHFADVATVVAAAVACVALAVYILRTSAGVVVRGSAENPQRALTLGINVGGVTGNVWLIAGLLASLSGIFGGVSALSPSGLVRALAVVVIARFVSLPLAVFAAVVLGMVNQGFLWNFKGSAPFEVVLLALICGFLLLQSFRASRAEQDSDAAWQASREVRPIPAELRHVATVENGIRLGSLLAVGALLAYPWVMNPSAISAGAATIVFAIMLFSLLILMGWAGQISLGHFGLAAIGAYVSSVITSRYGVPFPIAILVASLAGSVGALLVGLPALRIRGLFLGITTLAFGLAVSDVLLDPAYLGGPIPFSVDRPVFLGLDFNDDRIFFYFLLVCLALVATAVLGLRRSRSGRALIACRDNDAAAESFGINLMRTRLAAFGISGFLAAFAGALLMYEQHGVQAVQYAPTESINLFLIALIAGMGSVAGPLLGGVFLFGISQVPDLATVISGGSAAVVLMVAPGGLTQLVYSARDTFLRQVALRNRIIVPSLLADYRPGARGNQKAPLPAHQGKAAKPVMPDRYRLGGQWNIGPVEERNG